MWDPFISHFHTLALTAVCISQGVKGHFYNLSIMYDHMCDIPIYVIYDERQCK